MQALLHIDDHERIDTYRSLLQRQAAPHVDDLPTRRRRLVHMLGAAVGNRALTRQSTVQDAVDLLWSHPQARSELLELLSVLDARVDHIQLPLRTHPDVPLQVHARYSRIEILAAFGLGTAGKIAAWQSGVYEAKSANAELFAFTLDKSSGSFSPTTRYRDYAISPTLIHWESQSITRAQPDRPSVQESRTRRTHDPAVHPPSRRRPRLLVPGTSHLPQPRRREAHGHHVGARPSALRGPVLRIRRRRGVGTSERSAEGSRRRLDRQLPSERALSALDDLASGPVARGVHVVVEQRGERPRISFPCWSKASRCWWTLGDAAHRPDPQKPGFASRSWPEALEHLLGRCDSERLAT